MIRRHFVESRVDVRYFRVDVSHFGHDVSVPLRFDAEVIAHRLLKILIEGHLDALCFS
jgi:hypothetical protein